MQCISIVFHLMKVMSFKLQDIYVIRLMFWKVDIILPGIDSPLFLPSSVDVNRFEVLPGPFTSYSCTLYCSG